MKNQNFLKRFIFSLQGLKYAWQTEKSFRAQLMITILVLGSLLVLKASALWWAIIILIIGAALAAELLNTALENIIDLLHPEYHQQIGRAKDCAAAAVLVLSLASIIIFIFFILDRLQ